MKYTALTIPIFPPDILEYIQGRDEVCKIVLTACRKYSKQPEKTTITLNSRIFTELHFSANEVIAVMLDTAEVLMIKLSYGLILQQHEFFTVEDLASQLWKYMCRLIKAN